MIGDWVIFHDSGYASDGTTWEEDRVCQIDRIDMDVRVKWYDEDGCLEDWHHVSTFCLSPIPLTPEILEKNGFKKDEKLEEMYYWNWGIGNNCVSYDKETGIVRIFHVFGYLVFVLPLSYVHELQHALKLCGIEKEIEL